MTAAFVAPLYNTSEPTGPALPVADRSILTSQFRANSTHFRNRVLAGLTQVIYPS